MKVLLYKNRFTILFLITCLTINAQVKKDTILKKKNKKEAMISLSNNQVNLVIEEFVDHSDNISIVQGLATAVINLKIDKNVCEGLSYKLYDNSGELIAENPIIRSTTTILLHNTESENYVLNIIKGKESVKTFGFYH